MYARKISICLLLVLAACQGYPELSGTLPTPLIWQVQYTPALDWMGSYLNDCTRSQPDIGLIIDKRSAAFLDLDQSDFIFRWGAPAQVTSPAFTIGWDQLIIIVHPDNPLPALTLDELRGIYLGNIQNWSELDPQTPLTGDIQVWGYSQDDDIQILFEEQMGGKMNNPAVQLAPDVKAMIQAVGSSQNAIGYIPMRWLDDQVNILIIDELNPPPEIPILALTATQPQGAKKDWLLCLEDRLNQ